jgi:hypothetical protein
MHFKCQLQRLPQKNQCMVWAWPEKTAVVLACFIMMAALLLWALLADGAGTTHDTRLTTAAVDLLIQVEVVLILPLWLLLRVVYWITRHRQHSTVVNEDADSFSQTHPGGSQDRME